jgi:hypothetical protein
MWYRPRIESSRWSLAFRSRPARRRQRTDLVILAYIMEQSRPSLGSYGRPRMTGGQKEVGIDVGTPPDWAFDAPERNCP